MGEILKRKYALRSEAGPPKFFIPEQKGKVVYKAPGDAGATPAPLPPNIFKKDISLSTTLLLVKYCPSDQMHSLKLGFQ